MNGLLSNEELNALTDVFDEFDTLNNIDSFYDHEQLDLFEDEWMEEH